MNPIFDKKEPVSPPKFEPQAAAVDAPVLQVMSEEDAYIADRMKSQPKTLDEVLLVKEKNYAPGEHRLTLPKEFKVYEDRFSFRWINKKKRAIDESLIKGWIIVNRALFPDVARNSSYLFSTSGAVEKGDALLAFISKKIADDIRRAPGEKSNAILKAQLNKGKEGLPKGKSGFYKPEDGGANEDAGLQEGRDF